MIVERELDYAYVRRDVRVRRDTVVAKIDRWQATTDDEWARLLDAIEFGLARAPGEISVGDRVKLADETGQVITVESTAVGYGEHGRPIVETFVRVRLDVPSITPITTWVEPSEILEVLT